MTSINNKAYIVRFECNLSRYNIIHNTAYTFIDVQNKFIDIRMICTKYTNNRMTTTCMCGHSIKNIYEIINPATNDIMIVGSDCIKTYMINASLICIDCNNKFKFSVYNTTCKKCTKARKDNTKRCEALLQAKKLAQEKVNITVAFMTTCTDKTDYIIDF